jgi:hypothetical protein
LRSVGHKWQLEDDRNRLSNELATVFTLGVASTDGISAVRLAAGGGALVPTAGALGGRVVVSSTVIRVGDRVLHGTALTPAAESLAPLSALYRAFEFPCVFLSSSSGMPSARTPLPPTQPSILSPPPIILPDHISTWRPGCLAPDTAGGGLAGGE